MTPVKLHGAEHKSAAVHQAGNQAGDEVETKGASERLCASMCDLRPCVTHNHSEALCEHAWPMITARLCVSMCGPPSTCSPIPVGMCTRHLWK